MAPPTPAADSKFAAVLSDAASRVARVREALADGDLELAELIAGDLEHDLRRAVPPAQAEAAAW